MSCAFGSVCLLLACFRHEIYEFFKGLIKFTRFGVTTAIVEFIVCFGFFLVWSCSFLLQMLLVSNSHVLLRFLTVMGEHLLHLLIDWIS